MSLAQARIMRVTALRRSGTGWTRPLRAYQPTAAAMSPSRSSERDSFGGVVLAQVVGERPELFRMTLGEGGERSAGADGIEF
jgi:hypothetical protein